MAAEQNLKMRLPATAEAVEKVLNALEAYAENAELGPRASHHLVLLAEELAANVVMHGTQGPEPATYFALAIRRQADSLLLDLEDDGAAFDPFARAAPDITAGLEDRDPGGLGVHLIRKLSRHAEYRREENRNHIALILDATA